MPNRPSQLSGLRGTLILVLLLCFAPRATHAADEASPSATGDVAHDELVKIGVLAVTGREKTRKAYTPTAEYLGKTISGYRFEIVPITLPETPEVVANGEIDFLVTQGAGYAAVEYEYGVTRIATMRKRGPGGKAFSEFGAVVMVAADSEIKTFEDLPGHSFMAVGKTAFGGRWMAERELNDAGVDFEDFTRVEFSGFPQQGVARSVLAGEADAGTLRTGMLEGMIAKGEIKRSDFRVLGEVKTPGFPYVHSTRMYPEWAFAVLRHTDGELARQVAVGLLSMPADHPAAKASKTKGWAVPMDYQRVHELMKDLKVGAYVNLGKITATQLLKQYWHVMLGILVAAIAMGLAIVYVLGLNRRVTESRKEMRMVLDNVDQGLITIDRDCTMAEACSATLVQWLGPHRAGGSFVDYLGNVDSGVAEWFDASFSMALDGFMPLDVALAQMPKRLQLGEKIIQLAYTPIATGEDLEKLLVVMSDVTAQVEHERAEAEQREVINIFGRISKDKPGWLEFFAEAETLTQLITAHDSSDLTSLKRTIHTLKGNAALFGVTTIAEACHALEDWIAEHDAQPTAAETEALEGHWARVQAHSRLFLGGDIADRIEISDEDYNKVLGAVLDGAPLETLARIIGSWKLEATSTRLSRVAEQTRALATRMGKGDIEVTVMGNDLRTDAKQWVSFWSAFVHVIRNAVDHGLETKEQRIESGKSPAGHIKLATFVEGERFNIQISDDGRGINWQAIATKAKGAGLPTDTHEALVDALFYDGLSTQEAVSETSGRGVGMSALREAYLERGGSVHVTSEAGRGTAFCFSFPIATMTPGSEQTQQVPRAA